MAKAAKGIDEKIRPRMARSQWRVKKKNKSKLAARLVYIPSRAVSKILPRSRAGEYAGVLEWTPGRGLLCLETGFFRCSSWQCEVILPLLASSRNAGITKEQCERHII